jgi:hypothetical protein
MKQKIENPFVRKIALQKDLAAKFATLCIVCVLSLTVIGCKETNEAKMDEATFLQNLESAPAVIVSKEELPEWLILRIDFFETGAGMGIPQQLKVFRGLWNGSVIYFLEYLSNCGMCDVNYGSGERIVWSGDGRDYEKFRSESKDWSLVYQVVPDYGVIGKSALSEVARLSVEDKYEFPDISYLNDWLSEDIIPRRFKALQIPDNVLANISTAGLLETCLEFPYLLNIICSNDYQQGFEQGLLATFNGFRELMERPDLVDALTIKYNELRFEVQYVGGLSLLEIGMFAYRHFVLEMIIAQDIVIRNMSEEQARTLFLLASERMEIKRSYPDIFSGIHIVPTALMYAKKLKNDNLVRADMLDTLNNFMQAPTFVGQTTWKYKSITLLNKFRYEKDFCNIRFNILPC